MKRVSVIIPYFQRDAGVLTRALTTVFDQDVADTLVDVVVVDDASPRAPTADIAAAGAPPQHVSVRIIRRENGGPAAARNSGLDVLGADCDAVALLDSDDLWATDHLRRALAALSEGCDLYFSDHLDGDGRSHFEAPDIARRLRDLHLQPLTADGLFRCEPGDLAALCAEAYLAHTSSIVFTPGHRRSTRFDTVLRSAGEDHLFFLDLVLGAEAVALSRSLDVRLGRGVNIYASAQTWGTPEDLRRRAFNLYAKRQMISRANWPEDLRRRLERAAGQARDTVGYLCLRGLLTRPRETWPEVVRVWSLDRSALLRAPFSLLHRPPRQEA